MLDDNDVPMDNRVFVIPPAMKKELLGITNYEEPQTVQEVIEKFLAGLADKTTQNKLGSTRGAMALGSLWGNTLSAFMYSGVTGTAT